MQKSMHSVGEWFETPLGQYLLQQEQDYFDKTVADVFGFNAVQLGLAPYDFLRMSRIPLRFASDRDGAVKVKADFPQLPFATNSIDLLLLPHVLEFSENPHQILREAERVLMPEGQLVICGFNPRSLWGLSRMLRRRSGEYPWRGRFIALPRVKDWLALLGFEMAAGRLGCYVPPFKQEKWLSRFRFLEAAGDRWWAIAGGVYFLQAVKRVQGLRLIKPNWNDALKPKKSLAPVRRESKEPLIGSRVNRVAGEMKMMARREAQRIAVLIRKPSNEASATFRRNPQGRGWALPQHFVARRWCAIKHTSLLASRLGQAQPTVAATCDLIRGPLAKVLYLKARRPSA